MSLPSSLLELLGQTQSTPDFTNAILIEGLDTSSSYPLFLYDMLKQLMDKVDALTTAVNEIKQERASSSGSSNRISSSGKYSKLINIV